MSDEKENRELALLAENAGLRAEIEKLKAELIEANKRGDNASMYYQGIAARKLEEASETKNNYWILLTHAQALADNLEWMKVRLNRHQIHSGDSTINYCSDCEASARAEIALTAWKEFRK